MTAPIAKDAGSRERTRKRLEFALRRRDALVLELAPDLVCAICKVAQPSARHLEIDHVDGIRWDRYRMSPQMRAAKYWREHRAGVKLRALCQPCNARDGARHRRHKQRQRNLEKLRARPE